jgi:hypothetical protein
MNKLNQYYSVLHHWHKIIDALLEIMDIRNKILPEVFAWIKLKNVFAILQLSYNDDQCAYCLNKSGIDCDGCLIANKSGEYGCEGTPWPNFAIAMENNDLDKAYINAIRMRDFIIYSKPEEAK